MMFYSHLDPASLWNAFYTYDGRDGKRFFAPYHVMTAFGTLTSLGNTVDTTEDFRKELYSLATVGDGKGACVFSTADYNGIVEIRVQGADFSNYSIKGIIGGGERGAGYFMEEKNLPLRDGKLALRVGKNETYFLIFS